MRLRRTGPTGSSIFSTGSNGTLPLCRSFSLIGSMLWRNGFLIAEFVMRAPSDSWPRPAARRCCGILVRPTVKLVDVPEIDCGGDPLPGDTPEVPREALVAAEIETDGVTVSVVSAHPPHSAGRSDEERAWRLRGKLGIYDALTAWVTGRQNVVVGMDANWWLDSSPFSTPAWDDEDEQAAVARFFFDPEHGHGLRDAFRSFLSEHPVELERIEARRPNGPLAVTHVRGGNRPIADRFDALMVSRSAAYRVDRTQLRRRRRSGQRSRLCARRTVDGCTGAALIPNCRSATR